MMVLVSYDVSTKDKKGPARLRKVSKKCQDYGQRVQNSVFEIDVDYGTFVKVKNDLLKIIDEEKDSLRLYYLGNKWEKKIEHFGVKETYNPEGVIVV